MADLNEVMRTLGNIQGTLDAVKENQEALNKDLRDTDRDHEKRITGLETSRARLVGTHAGATGLLAMLTAWWKWGGTA